MKVFHVLKQRLMAYERRKKLFLILRGLIYCQNIFKGVECILTRGIKICSSQFLTRLLVYYYYLDINNWHKLTYFSDIIELVILLYDRQMFELSTRNVEKKKKRNSIITKSYSKQINFKSCRNTIGVFKN